MNFLLQNYIACKNKLTNRPDDQPKLPKQQRLDIRMQTNPCFMQSIETFEKSAFSTGIIHKNIP